jgi:hypothetical protein
MAWENERNTPSQVRQAVDASQAQSPVVLSGVTERTRRLHEDQQFQAQRTAYYVTS